MEKNIVFGERWSRGSYHVTYEGAYNNPNPPHVQTEEENLTGKTFRLGERKQFRVRGDTVVMYEVIGLTNRKKPAHITVYFGSGEGAERY